MKKTKKELERKIELLEREQFLAVYDKFNEWLYSLGLRRGHYWKESATGNDYHYSHYDKHIDALYSVEHYVHDTLNLSIRFLRDRYKHQFMFVGNFGMHSAIYPVEQAKELILADIRRLRDEQLAKLSALEKL